MLLTLSVRNKDYKEWSGFFVTLVLHGEFNFFPSKLCLILAEEKHNFHLRRVRFYLGGGGQQCLSSPCRSLFLLHHRQVLLPPVPGHGGVNQEVHEKSRN